MTTMTIGRAGELTLPLDVQERCGLKPETAVRLIETRSGVLLVPLTDEPMDTELVAELQEWQELGQHAWAQFPCEADEGLGNVPPEAGIGKS